MKRYRFLHEALVEYEDAIEYYERAQSGLGETFIRDAEEVIALTLEFPDMGSGPRLTSHGDRGPRCREPAAHVERMSKCAASRRHQREACPAGFV